jgi:ankyrin repeat protein
VNRHFVSRTSVYHVASLFIAMVGFILILSSCDQSNIFDAARDGKLERVKILLKSKPDLVNSRDALGKTPLEY